ncbi:hypothetical protein [Gimesia panareensis]|uniref:Uncharacterized protein n=1 Tax=Gimesia panareensis TaxID=2527978 RepID=A0A518A3Z8_9PLAN|nr:hypothetical protein [Gimesia panareensis]QDU49439.1 hypothetical protein Pan110_17750 [Gimesia panareensis]QDV17342.1 hypothetical protein Pan153_19770 [Gimesia panareensis]
MLRPGYPTRSLLVILCLLAYGLPVPAQASEPAAARMQELKRFPAREAHQAVAVDGSAFYAISSREIGRYDKQTGQLIKLWSPPRDSHIRHLNSGIVIDGKLYCAHSNWPATPLKNTIEVFDAENLRPLQTLKFPDTTGAINWVDRRQGKWWVVFAFYGKADNVKLTRLVRYNDQWEPEAEWTFPEQVVQRFLPNSNSGGAWGPGGLLYVTGHDHGELYVLRVPEKPGVMEYVETITAPIAGQGIAWDQTEEGIMYGIIRKQKEVVKLQLKQAR